MLPILNQSFWRDEAFSVLLSEKAPWQIITLTIKDQSPPLYSLILHYWMLAFGQSEVAVRGLSFLFHIGTVVTIYLLARRLIRSFPTQLLITAAVLINPFLLQYAFEARMYSMLAFLATLGVYFLVLRKYWIAGIIFALGILTHNFGLFNFVAIALWWVYLNRKHLRDRFQEGFSLLFLPVLIFLLWSGVIWNQWERVGKGFWIKPVTSAIFLNSLRIYSQGDISYPSQEMILLLSFILFFFAFSYWVWHKEKEDTSAPSLFFSLALLPIVITYIVSELFAPIYHERYLIATAPMLILLVGYSLYKTALNNPTRQILLTVFVSSYMTILILSSEQIVNQVTKTSINWGVGQILSQARPGDIIIPRDALNYLETKLYVEQSGKNIPVYAYSPTGKIPFYIGAILFDKQHIVTSLPKNKRIWQVEPDGGYRLIYNKKLQASSI